MISVVNLANKRPRVVIARRIGRLCNRLVLFSHFVASGIEHGFDVANPCFGHYARYFPTIAGDMLCRFPGGGRLPAPPLGYLGLYCAIRLSAASLYRLQRMGLDVGLIRLRRDQYVDLDGEPFLSFVRGRGTVLVQDWYFRSEKNCETHAESIRGFFKPWPHHLARVQSVVDGARRGNKFLVGVHVRRDDYAKFRDGQFLFSHEQYRQVMQDVEAAFPRENVAFLICSDEPLPRQVFHGFDATFGTGHELEDLYALAACDRLVGPPSTYSRWASYYGHVPRYEFDDPSQPVDDSLFRVDARLMLHRALPFTRVNRVPP